MSDSLIDILAARSGIVCAVGAGGKKTTLHRIAQAHPGRVGLTATVPMTPVPDDVGAETVIGPAETLADLVPERAERHRVVVFAEPSVKAGRLAGLDPAAIAPLHRDAHFDVTLVKADGARMRFMKAPQPDEPALPPGVTTVLPVVSARIVGRPLTDKLAHRVERIEQVTGVRQGEPVTPTHIARLLASDRGALHRVGDTAIVPIINMVDDAATAELARQAAREALSLTDRFDRVVLASMTADEPVTDVVYSA